MHLLKKLKWQSLSLIYRKFSDCQSNVYIASAVRTPILHSAGYIKPLSAEQFGALVIEASIKQSSIPFESVGAVFMTHISDKKDVLRKAASSAGLRNNVSCNTVCDENAAGLKAIASASEAVKTGKVPVAVAGGLYTTTNKEIVTDTTESSCSIDISDEKVSENTENDRCPDEIEYVRLSHEHFVQAVKKQIFAAESVPVSIQKQRKVNFIQTKEKANTKSKQSEGAAALILTNDQMVKELNLHPLVRVVMCNHSIPGPCDDAAVTITKLMAENQIQPCEISRWEIDDKNPRALLALIKELEIEVNKVNKHGGGVSFDNFGLTGSRLVTHLAHCLRPGKFGAAMTFGSNSCVSLIVLEKLITPFQSSKGLPILTLYTKDECPLCDILVNELESEFCGEYELKKVFIDQKENVRFLRLYRYDIPVLFLNGQFLCMHSLNTNLLRLKLRKIKSWNKSS